MQRAIAFEHLAKMELIELVMLPAEISTKQKNLKRQIFGISIKIRIFFLNCVENNYRLTNESNEW